MKVLVPVHQITLVIQKEMSRHYGINKRIKTKILNKLNMSRHGGMNTRIQIKILNELNAGTSLIMLLTAPTNMKLRKILESSIIALERPSLKLVCAVFLLFAI